MHLIKKPIDQLFEGPIIYMDFTVGNNFKLVKKLNAGSFGEIYLGLNLKNKREVAIKLQSLKTKNPQLQYEAKLLAYILGSQGKQQGFPRLFFYGKEQSYSVMVLELLGPSLEELFQKCQKRFDLKTTVMVGIQIVNRLEYLHKRKFIHRDIKPENFLLGTHENCGIVYLIDFGLSKKYLQKNGQHIPYKDNKSLTGTPRYASINSHLGIQQGRRDDLQSVTYMLIYFLKGCLPWQNLRQDENYGKYEKILQKKLSVKVENLVQGIPKQFGEILQYTRNLYFPEDPDYDLIRNLLKQSLGSQEMQLSTNEMYCWQIEKEEEKVEKEEKVDFFNFQEF